MGCRRRVPVERTIAVEGFGRVGILAGRAHIYGLAAKSGAVVALVVGIGIEHGEQEFAGAGSGHIAYLVHVPGVVRGTGSGEDAGRAQPLINFAPGGLLLAEHAVDAKRSVGGDDESTGLPVRRVVTLALVYDVLIRSDDVADHARLQQHELDIPVDTGHALLVVAPGPDDARDGMAVLVGHVHRGVGDEVPAHEVVHIAVVVVVNAVAEGFGMVLPDVFAQVLVQHVEPAVEYGHDDGVALGGEAARGEAPGFIGTDSEDPPLFRYVGVIGALAGFEDVVEVRAFDVRESRELFEELIRAYGGRIVAQQADVLGLAQLFLDPDPPTGTAVGGKVGNEVLGRQCAPELDDDLAPIGIPGVLGRQMGARQQQYPE